MEHIYYLVYAPNRTKFLMETNPEPMFYIPFGYYISGCYPMDDEDGIVFAGVYDKCVSVAIGLCHFTMN